MQVWVADTIIRVLRNYSIHVAMRGDGAMVEECHIIYTCESTVSDECRAQALSCEKSLGARLRRATRAYILLWAAIPLYTSKYPMLTYDL